MGEVSEFRLSVLLSEGKLRCDKLVFWTLQRHPGHIPYRRRILPSFILYKACTLRKDISIAFLQLLLPETSVSQDAVRASQHTT